MPGFLLRGALIEYGSDFLGPLPNIVIFQFNPEKLDRTLNIPSEGGSGSEGRRQTEQRQTSSPPTESLTISAHFSAADDLGQGGAVSAIPRIFGIGPQLAALEKMVFPAAGGSLLGAALDAVGDALGLGGGDEAASRPIPREQLPRILFIWGVTRVLPVKIQSMTISEQKFDALLNPVQAEVSIGLEVIDFNAISGSGDTLGTGALQYSQTVKEAQAVLNLAKAVELAVDIIPI